MHVEHLKVDNMQGKQNNMPKEVVAFKQVKDVVVPVAQLVELYIKGHGFESHIVQEFKHIGV